MEGMPQEINGKFSIGKVVEFRSYLFRMRNYAMILSCAVGLLMVPSQAADEKHTVLHDQMEAMNDAFKAFRRETDPVKGATQARLAQQAALKSAMEVPELVTAMPEGPEKAKALLTYRKMMGKLLVTLCEVEEAFLDGKIEEVAKIVDSLKEQKKAGHDKFMDEDEE
jgi:soluble cytochrome b562